MLIQCLGFRGRGNAEDGREGLPAAVIGGDGLGMAVGRMIAGDEAAVEPLGQGSASMPF